MASLTLRLLPTRAEQGAPASSKHDAQQPVERKRPGRDQANGLCAAPAQQGSGETEGKDGAEEVGGFHARMLRASGRPTRIEGAPVHGQGGACGRRSLSRSPSTKPLRQNKARSDQQAPQACDLEAIRALKHPVIAPQPVPQEHDAARESHKGVPRLAVEPSLTPGLI